ncbi:hypothetical protein M9H77_08468 [Catharanthus roseus]|uniref:Uncharacterized protein n=1 Tax=Catharanthus roseus TaxID=4058 RepID=A0ACC0BYA4_CATRO|nr:hypothetical protein M9H77_08468 [Catharanthus roseus]
MVGASIEEFHHKKFNGSKLEAPGHHKRRKKQRTEKNRASSDGRFQLTIPGRSHLTVPGRSWVDIVEEDQVLLKASCLGGGYENFISLNILNNINWYQSYLKKCCEHKRKSGKTKESECLIENHESFKEERVEEKKDEIENNKETKEEMSSILFEGDKREEMRESCCDISSPLNSLSSEEMNLFTNSINHFLI